MPEASRRRYQVERDRQSWKCTSPCFEAYGYRKMMHLHARLNKRLTKRLSQFHIFCLHWTANFAILKKLCCVVIPIILQFSTLWSLALQQLTVSQSWKEQIQITHFVWQTLPNPKIISITYGKQGIILEAGIRKLWRLCTRNDSSG